MLFLRRFIQPTLLFVVVAFALHHAVAVRAAPSQTLQVTQITDGDDGVCDAHCTLREAVAVANNSPGFDTINMPAPGFVNLIMLSLGELAISDNVRINCNDWSIVVQGGQRAFNVAPSGELDLFRCLISGGSGPFGGAISNGGTLQVRYSSILNSSATQFGGAIYSDGDAVSIVYSTFEGNSAESGGTLYTTDSTVTIENSTLRDSTATAGGGIIFSSRGDVTVRDSVLTAGTAGADGGAIHNGADSVILLDSTSITNTHAADPNFIEENRRGGAIANAGGTVTLQNGTYIRSTTADFGGAIANTAGGTVIARNTTFGGSTATEYGGAIYNLDGTVLVEQNSQLIGSSANGEIGDAIANFAGATTILDSLIAGNGNIGSTSHVYNADQMHVERSTFSTSFPYYTALHNVGAGTLIVRHSHIQDYADWGIRSSGQTLHVGNTTLSSGGVGIEVTEGTFHVENSTISGNSLGGFQAFSVEQLPSSSPAGTLSHVTLVDNATHAILAGQNAAVTIQNSLIAAPDDVPNCVTIGSGQLIATAHSLNEDGSCGAATTGSGYFDPLADNGGSTPTHAIISLSEAIGLGDPALCLGSDQRGYGRGAGACDAGAFEREATPTAVLVRDMQVGVSAEITIIGLIISLQIALTYATKRRLA